LFKREDEGGAAHVVNGMTNPNGGVNGFGKGRPRREVPGAAPVEPTEAAGDDSQLSKSALKNKKKREAAKKKAEQEKASGSPPQQPQQGGKPAQQRAEGEQREQGQPREGRNPRTENLANRRNDHRSRSRANQDNRRSKSRPNNGERGNSNGNGNGQGQGHHREGSKHLSPANIVTDQPAADGPLSPSPEEKKRRALHKKLRAIEDLKMRQASGEKLEDTQVKKIATEAEVRRDLDKLGGITGSG